MNYLKVFLDWADQASELTDEEFGSLILALMSYATGETDVQPIGAARYLFPVFRKYVDREAAAYEDVCEKRREAGRKGGLAKQANAKQKAANDSNAKQNEASLSKTYQEKEQEKQKENEEENENEIDLFYQEQEQEDVFEDDLDMNDDLERINNFIIEKGLSCDAREFYDYYSERNWEIGGRKIDNWKGLLVSWDKSNKVEPLKAVSRPPKEKPRSNSTFDTDDFFEAALRASYGVE